MGCTRPNVRNLDPRSWADLHKTLRDRLWTGRILAARKGLRLELNSGGRSDGQQYDLRHGRCPGRECDRRCKGKPTTALPGRSNHRNLSEKISAADMMGTGLSFLHQHQDEYGIHFPVPGEAWHAENHGRPTVEIIEWPNLAPVRPDLDAGRTFKQFKANVTDDSVYAANGLRHEVSGWQMILAELGFFHGPITGNYFTQTVEATQRFKEAASWRDPQGKRDRSSVVSALLYTTGEALVRAKSGK